MDPLIIAETLKAAKPDRYDWSNYDGQEADTALYVWEQTVGRFADKLTEENPSFDRVAFFRMSGRTRPS